MYIKLSFNNDKKIGYIPSRSRVYVISDIILIIFVTYLEREKKLDPPRKWGNSSTRSKSSMTLKA